MIKLKVAISTSLIILCLISIWCLLGCKISVKACTEVTYAPNVIYVPTNYSTIQEAINHANSGDKIFVHISIYSESVVINKSISLVGENRDFTIINGNETRSVIIITADNVNVTDFTVMKSGSISPSDSGIRIEYSSGIVISHNKIIDNNVGISLYFSSSTVISGNIVSSNYYNGISLYSSSNNVVSGNIVSSNYYNGISLYSSSNNVVSGNTILDNYNGIYLTFSSNNTIYHNNCDNGNQVWSDSANVWNYGYEGNYWSDYLGHDLNGDGIGDNPYVKPYVIDRYPLMGMFSVFKITLPRETYDIAVISNSTISKLVLEIGGETGNKIMLFDATGKDGTIGFCRITIPTELMAYPYIVLIGSEEIIPTLIGISNEKYAHLYFTYFHKNYTIKIISSEALRLYNELLDSYLKLQIDLSDLNMTYYGVLNNYSVLMENYLQLQKSYGELNDSYREHLLDYSEQIQNIRSLMYIFAATTAIFLITTIYLSKRAHTSITTKTKVFEDEK